VFGGFGPPPSAPEVIEGDYFEDDVYLNDTWTWDGHAWHQANAAAPSPRRDALIAFDPASRRVVLTCGAGPANAATQAAPVGVEDPEPVGDPNQCGGCPYPATYLGDTWMWDGSHWTQQTGKVPTARSGAGVAFDPLSRRLLMFGGTHS